MKKVLSASILTLSLTTLSANAQVLFTHTFDGVANDTTSPSIQGFDNGVGNAAFNLTTGVISGSSSAAAGWNTAISGLDLSSYSGFTIEFVVENDVSAAIGGLNGSFFGVATSGTANDTGGSALYNNAGTASLPAIGLQIGSGRGSSDTSEFVIDAGASTYDPGLGNPADDGTTGYTIFVTFENAGSSTTDVTITSTGLTSNYNYSTTVGYDYATIFANATPNVSTQGGNIDLASITITAVPEPSTFALLAGCLSLGAVMLRRHRS